MYNQGYNQERYQGQGKLYGYNPPQGYPPNFKQSYPPTYQYPVR